MELFQRAQTIRLISHKDKYLLAEEDRLTISLGRGSSAKNAIWAVEFAEVKDCIRFKSCFGTYLTASSTPFISGVTAKKVIQTWSCQCDSATEWEPFRDGMQVRLRSFWGNFLRPNGGLPPWRNSITHDIPHRIKTRDKILWDVEVVEKWSTHRHPQSFCRSRSVSAAMGAQKQIEIRRVLLNNESAWAAQLVPGWQIATKGAGSSPGSRSVGVLSLQMWGIVPCGHQTLFLPPRGPLSHLDLLLHHLCRTGGWGPEGEGFRLLLQKCF